MIHQIQKGISYTIFKNNNDDNFLHDHVQHALLRLASALASTSILPETDPLTLTTTTSHQNANKCNKTTKTGKLSPGRNRTRKSKDNKSNQTEIIIWYSTNYESLQQIFSLLFFL